MWKSFWRVISLERDIEVQMGQSIGGILLVLERSIHEEQEIERKE